MTDIAHLERILYVEDEAMLQLITRKTLEKIGGFTVEVCGLGGKAVAMARAFRPDIILLDVMMPDIDGPTVLEHLRQDPETLAIPVIFVTAKVQPEEIERFLALGAVGVIAKPFDPLTLSEDVRNHWQRHHSRQAG